MRLHILSFLFFSFSILKISGQGEIDIDKILLMGNERSAAISLYTNGWGFDYRYGKRINYTRKNILDVGFSYLKNPKEDNRADPYTGYKFVFGKTNLFVTLHGGYGLQKEIFSKADKGGISIKLFAFAGPSIGFYKPIYYWVYVAQKDTTSVKMLKKFDLADIHQKSQIERKAAIYYGLKETKIVPGVYSKFGFQFEFSRKKSIIHAIECGAMAEIFPKKIPIMAFDENNQQFFIELYITYRFGKITNPLIRLRKEEIKKYLEENLISK